MKFLGIPSAISQYSKAHALLRQAAFAVRSRNHEVSSRMEIANISTLPLFDPDRYKTEHSFPDSVKLFRTQLHEAHGVLFSVNEREHGHFYSISGPLQNAMDWGLHYRNLFQGKPTAFISHGSDRFHGENCFHLRLQCIAFGALCLRGPEYTGPRNILYDVQIDDKLYDLSENEVKQYVDSVVLDLLEYDSKKHLDRGHRFHLVNHHRKRIPLFQTTVQEQENTSGEYGDQNEYPFSFLWEKEYKDA